MILNFASGDHNHLIQQVLVYSHPQDSLHLDVGAGLPGHVGPPGLEAASEEQRPDWEWSDTSRSVSPSS